MSLRPTAVLAVAVVLVGGFYYWYEIEGSKRRHAAEEHAKRLLAVPPDAVSAITLHRGEMTLRADRRDGTWHLTRPRDARADQKAVGRLVEAAAQATRLRVIAEGPLDLAAFGLASPRLIITLETASGAATLAIGEASPTGRGVYARVGSEGPVVLLEREVERAADQDLLAFRDKRLFDVDLMEVTSLRIVTGAEPIVVKKKGARDWLLTEPLEAPADAVAVEDLLGVLTRGRIQRFIDEPASDPAHYGLAAPRVSLTLTARDGRTLGPLHLGNAVEGEQGAASASRLYARRGDGGTVLVLEETIVKAVPADPQALRDRQLLAFELDEVERLEVATADETLVVEKGGEGAWAMTRPLAVEADGSAVRNLLWDLKAVRATAFLDEADPAEPRFGFGPSARRYGAYLKGRSEALQLEVGGEAEGGAARYVRVAGRRGLVTVEADAVGKLEVTSLTLRDRRLMAFEPEAVRRVEVTGPTQRIALWKDGPVWTLTKPDPREVPEGRVRALFWALKRLQFSGVVEERHTGKPTGNVLLEAHIWTDAATPQRLSVLRAPEDAGGAPRAVGSGRPGLYTVSEADLERVEDEIKRLLTRTE